MFSGFKGFGASGGFICAFMFFFFFWGGGGGGVLGFLVPKSETLRASLREGSHRGVWGFRVSSFRASPESPIPLN